MADKEEGKETSTRRNEWEVVTLTDSTYAAAPGPEAEKKIGDKAAAYSVDDTEISHALFMSGHFVFPPSQHENLPLEPENIKITEEQGCKDDLNELETESCRSSGNDLKDRTDDEFPGEQALDVMGSQQSFHSKEFEESMDLHGLNRAGMEQSPYSDATLRSLEGDTGLDGSNSGLDSPEELAKSLKTTKDDNYCESDLPCGAWWMKRAASLYAHAKEANSFWSIFVAAAVMGLVILGQRWQQERWQVLQHKWHLTINDEKMGRVLGPIYRIKDVIVGGHRRGSFIRGSSASEN